MLFQLLGLASNEENSGIVSFAISIAQRSLHPIERLLQQLQIARLAELLARAIDPFLLQRVLGRAIALVEDPEYAGERR